MAATKVALITGAGSGIGRALTLNLASGGIRVIAVGRRKEKLEETQSAAADRGLVDVCAADVATEEGRRSIVDAVVRAGQPLDFVVQNAGTIGPISGVMDVEHSAWLQTFAVNVHAPLFLLQALRSHLSSGARVLHIGSGASERAIGGWAAYCASKAAFKSLYRSLALELQPSGVSVGSVRPGIVDTPMQAVIRGASEAAMPDVAMFREFYDKRRTEDGSATTTSSSTSTSSSASGGGGSAPPSGGLDSASNCATFLRFLLTEVPAEEFTAQEWDIRDESHHSRWVRSD